LQRLANPVVVSPDLGNTKRARNFAQVLDAPLAIIEKRRAGNTDRSEVLNLIGAVDGCQVVIVDDEIDTAGSITQAAQVCVDNGATEVYATCVHPVLSGPAIDRLAQSVIREIVVTDTIPMPLHKQLDKITVLSIAPLLGETLQRIHTGTSVGAAYKAATGAMTLRMPI
jgi:ribose-phosphate pyrophosphokinase